MLALKEISRLHQEIEAAGKMMVDKAIRIGQLLSEQKTSMKHGGWMDWVESNLPFGVNQSAKYMRAFTHRKTLNSQSTVNLEGAIAALAKPKTAHVSHNTGENEWYTPPKFVEAAREVMGGIDTDPASSKVANKTIRADTYYDVKDDGLEREWGKTVWINPPYSQPEISQFCETLLQKLKTGEVEKACALVNNATETAFGQQLLKCCDAVCFPSGRIKFLDIQGNEGAPLQGQMIVYFGCLADKFCAEFEQFGVCLYAR